MPEPGAAAPPAGIRIERRIDLLQAWIESGVVAAIY
jgi:hypothetical protein